MLVTSEEQASTNKQASTSKQAGTHERASTREQASTRKQASTSKQAPASKHYITLYYIVFFVLNPKHVFCCVVLNNRRLMCFLLFSNVHHFNSLKIHVCFGLCSFRTRSKVQNKQTKTTKTHTFKIEHVTIQKTLKTQ